MKAKMKAVALAVTLGLAAGAANAATFAEGVLGDGGFFTLSDSGIHGNFTDTYNFSLSTTNEISLSASVNTRIAGKNTTPTINNFNMSLYEGATLLSSNAASIDLISGAGSYSLVLTGQGVANGKSGGSYGGSVSISAVPEPTEGALLLSGIGLIGFIAARRKNEA